MKRALEEQIAEKERQKREAQAHRRASDLPGAQAPAAVHGLPPGHQDGYSDYTQMGMPSMMPAMPVVQPGMQPVLQPGMQPGLQPGMQSYMQPGMPGLMPPSIPPSAALGMGMQGLGPGMLPSPVAPTHPCLGMPGPMQALPGAQPGPCAAPAQPGPAGLVPKNVFPKMACLIGTCRAGRIWQNELSQADFRDCADQAHWAASVIPLVARRIAARSRRRGSAGKRLHHLIPVRCSGDEARVG